MAFSRPVFTNAGKELQAKALAGECEIKFTAIALGSGELITQSIAELTDLIKPIKRCELTEIKHTAIDTIQLKSKFENTSQTSGFYWREVGLFAADPNEPSNRAADILYCYQNAGDIAEYIAAPDQQIIDKILCMAIAISDSAKVSAVIKSELYADREEFNAHLTDAEAHKDLLNNFAKSVNSFAVTENNNIELSEIRNSYAEDNQKYSSVFGGEAYGKGAGLFAYGAKHAEYPGYFDLYAMTSEGGKAELVGTPAGSLTWQDHEVITAKGGTMNGRLTFLLNDAIYRNVDTSYLHLCGGNVFGKSASLILNGGQNLDGSSSYGGFELSATNGEDITNLIGQSTGSLTWGGKNLVRSVNGVNADTSGNVEIKTGLSVDYTAGVTLTAGTDVTISADGIVNIFYNEGDLSNTTYYFVVKINGVTILNDNVHSYGENNVTLIVKKGDVIFFSAKKKGWNTGTLYPFK